MKRIATIPVILLALAAGATYYFSLPGRGPAQAEPAGSMSAAEQHGGSAPAERKILYWVDPMHPAYKSDKPGKAPDCGMDLVPVYAEEAPAEEMPVGTVRISARKLQLIGVQYGEVTSGPVARTLRTVGRVTFDETKVSHIHTKVSGYIEEVFVDFVGKYVRKGDPLFTIYSPELVATQEEYLVARRAQDYLKGAAYPGVAAGADSLLRASLERLRLWDVSEEDITRLEQEGTVARTVTIRSPVSGVVTERAAYHHGRYVSPEMDLYAIVDLSTVWVLADIYEYEVSMIRRGQRATMTLSYLPGQSFTGSVAFIYPQLDATTRTLKVRLEFPNPRFELKPDMFANVELQIDYGRQLSVPEEAVLDSGSEQMVFVAHEAGYFEPRPVRLGAKVDNRYIVLSGLKAGERIVTSGNFLIDAESRLKSAMGAMGHGEAPATKKPSPPPAHQQ
jgi:multidrug efflux pump subunit AcrA (membrane-fusion protein)